MNAKKAKAARKQLRCNHEYKKISFYEEMENGVRFSMRNYQCQNCGKKITVDGRQDPYSK